ncbi:MAG: hypothetical protein ACYDDF_00765 [Thermoplasmatota archaeon]
MDAKKAFGVESAIGRSIAERDLEDALRRIETADEFRRFLPSIPTTVPPDLVAQWAQGIEEAEWTKARSKLLLGAKLAKGSVKSLTDDEVERKGPIRHRG